MLTKRPPACGRLQAQRPAQVAHDDPQPLPRIAGEVCGRQPVLKPGEPSVKVLHGRHDRARGPGSFGGGAATMKSL